ncbi:MAG: hypothetical protein JXA04_11350, partial [Gammaproteobacteria bacterium]|nr:hypothetical protein [Gammaproteobacteria bacterium]
MSPDNLLGRTSDREVVLTRILREKIIAFLSALVLFSSPIFAENSFSEQETLFLERFDQYVQDEIG